MNIPKKFKVGGTVYEIVYKDMVDNEEEYRGCANFREQRIEIKNGLAKEYAERTFLHEVIHLITNFLSIEWGKNDELWTESMANVLHQIIKDNKDVFKEDR